MLSRLYVYHVQVNVGDRYGSTPLHLACQVGNLEGVTVLLKNKHIKLDAKDGNGDTPLHEACFHGKKGVTKTLLDVMKESNKLHLMTVKNGVGLTPFHLACQKGHCKIAELLIGYFSSNDESKLVMAVDNDGETPLHLACQNDNNDEIVGILLKHHAKVTASNNEGIIPVHIAARYGCLKVMCMLLNHSSVNVINTTDHYGQTPLHFAAENGKEDMVHLLLDKCIKYICKLHTHSLPNLAT